jgi:hypothetical protein
LAARSVAALQCMCIRPRRSSRKLNTPPPLPKQKRTALTPLYEHLCIELGLPKDAAKAAAMRATNEQRLKELADKVTDAEENLGETEVRDAVHARAEYLGKIGDREGAAKAFAETEEKTASGGAKADMVFSQIRWGGWLCCWEGRSGWVQRWLGGRFAAVT